MRADYWRGELVRLRPLALDDVEAWLAEDTDPRPQRRKRGVTPSSRYTPLP